MKKKMIKDITASIHQRLQNKARDTGRPFNELLQYFGMERFLYRLSTSSYVDKFVLKGGLMFAVWQAPASRPTMDIDLLGKTNNDIESIKDIIQKILLTQVEDDGIIFDPQTISAERITEDADYSGIRFRFYGKLGNARISMQLDIGFGDIVFPEIAKTEYPTILDLPSPTLHGYSKESVISEKFQAMVKLDILNSRMKDFYDIWLMMRQFDFDGNILADAIKKTFSNRNTEIILSSTLFTSEFMGDSDKQLQWQSFLRKSKMTNAPEQFAEVINELLTFLEPLTNALTSKVTFNATWKAPGPWYFK